MSKAPNYDYYTYHTLYAEYEKIVNPPGSYDKTGKYIGHMPRKEFFSEIRKNEERFEENHPGFNYLKEMHDKLDKLFEKETLKEHEYNNLPPIFKNETYYKEEETIHDSSGYGLDFYPEHKVKTYKRLKSPENALRTSP